MENVYYAVYRKGRDEPLGVVGEKTLSPLLVTLNNINPEGHYAAKVITPEQAKEIDERMTECSYKLEDLLK